MFILYPLFFLFSFLYSIAGLGGGSAYVALLSISGIEEKYIPSTALFLNMIVTFIGFFNYRVHLNFKERKSFLISLYSISGAGAFLGSKLHLRRKEFLLIVGIFLVISSIISFFKEKIKDAEHDPSLGRKRNFKILLVLIFGFLLGFLAGLAGIGGGIFLSPILLITGFPLKEIAGITSIYIFLNSFSGFLSHLIEGKVNSSWILPLAFPVTAGASMGSFLGSFKFKPIAIKRILALTIFIIGVRVLWRAIL